MHQSASSSTVPAGLYAPQQPGTLHPGLYKSHTHLKSEFPGLQPKRKAKGVHSTASILKIPEQVSIYLVPGLTFLIITTWDPSSIIHSD